MCRLGMSLRAIGAALGVDERTVRKALAGLASRRASKRSGKGGTAGDASVPGGPSGSTNVVAPQAPPV